MPLISLVLVCVLVALLLGLASVSRRRRESGVSPAVTAALSEADALVNAEGDEPDPESAELRVLRAQVRTLTEALDSIARETPTAAREPRRRRPPRAAPASIEIEPGQVVPELVAAALVEQAATNQEPAPRTTTPDYGSAALEVEFRWLSRSLARDQRPVQAALAQWAADVLVLAPLLGERSGELPGLLDSLAPVDPRGAVVAARAAALSLVRHPGFDLSMLGPTEHLDTTAGPEAPSAPDLGGLAVFDPAEVRAFEETLCATAAAADDARAVSVALRVELVSRRSASPHAPDPARPGVLRDVLQASERSAYDERLGRSAS